MDHIRSIVITLESLNVFVWIVILLFSSLFLDSPTAKFSHLAPLYIPLIFGCIILLLTVFVLKTNTLIIVGLILSLISSAPAVFYISKKTSHIPKSTIADRKPFVLEAGYTSIVDYLSKNQGKEITINGKIFIQDQNSGIESGENNNAKLFVNRMPLAEVVVIELHFSDRTWHGKEVIVHGVLSRLGDTWVIEEPLVEGN